MSARLWNRTVLHNDCWVWTGAVKRSGYGRIAYGGKQVATHRLAYALAYGAIPGGLQIDHLCRERACINPAHLEAVTSRENTLRSRNHVGHQIRATHCLHGHAFTPENTRIYRGWRCCRTCNRERTDK